MKMKDTRAVTAVLSIAGQMLMGGMPSGHVYESVTRRKKISICHDKATQNIIPVSGQYPCG
jgi:hypothetical protein